ncbi:MAG: hypothetical protein IJ210_00785 [Clostridia bacterium]|nr:hypothetical protein [Clostridia bacterium]
MIRIVPYRGFDDITFDLSLDEVKGVLRSKHLRFQIEHWPNKECDPDVAWDVVRIGQEISLYFAEKRMFKMVFEQGFPGKLDNGITPGMPIREARGLDDTLEFDAWDEVYLSALGYWLEDDAESGEILTITIFIHEVEDDDVFYRYDWCTHPD